MKTPKVSICIPAYKQTKYLRKTLASVVAQDFMDYEIILTDDSPKDSVGKLVSEFDLAGKLSYFKNNDKKGTPENWNEAVRRSSGEYIKILHHDDWFSDKNSLAEFVHMLEENPDADFAFSASSILDNKGNLKSIFFPNEDKITSIKKDPRALLLGNFIGTPSVTIYRRSVNKYFNPSLKWLVDIDFYIRALRQNRFFAYCSIPLVCITTGADSQVTAQCSANAKIQVFEWIYLYKKYYQRIWPNFSNIKFLWKLLNMHEVRTVKEVVNTGHEHPIPHYVRIVIGLLKIKEFLKKGYSLAKNIKTETY